MDDMVVDHRGYLYDNVEEMCKSWKISKKIYLERIASGWNVEDALTMPSKVNEQLKQYKDHLGHNYTTFSSMCKAYDIVPKTLYWRLKSGWSLERALTEKLHNMSPRGKVVKSFEGLEFESKIAMVKHYGICKTTYERRIKDGYDQRASLLIPSGIILKRIFKPSMVTVSGETEYYAISCPICLEKLVESKLDIIEHLIQHREKNESINKKEYIVFNKKFNSLNEICEELLITKSAVQRWMGRGFELEEAVIHCMKNKRKEELVKKKSKRVMCKHYGISEVTYEKRIKAGYNQRASLLIPKGINLNKIFKSSMDLFSENTKYYAITCPICNVEMNEPKSNIIEHFIQHGEKKETINNEKYTVFNKKYGSLEKICQDHSITRSALQRKLNLGWELEEAVNYCLKNRRGPRIKSGLSNIVHNTNCNDKMIKSFEGLEFKSKRAMYNHYNICKKTYERRIKDGYDQRASLLIPSIIALSKVFKKSSVVLGTGKESEYYTTACPICKENMVDTKPNIIEHLIQHHNKNKSNDKKEYTVFNKKYRSLRNICEDLSITRTTLQRKLKSGVELEEAVLYCMNIKKNNTKNV
ncbi:hypothetical protein PIROE2DRAFT_21434 [Piromyces sp. E2]|nr:hypothetical protein PIROE2DRAFT_21434 [Piromyces sp. E2]|eukprot:OUM57868.1 hypothetical protein PIROE2DRAFT_21434 [Piromyces sp. E2]